MCTKFTNHNMSDQVKGLIVTFSNGISIEQAEKYKAAISLMAGVVNVEHSVDDWNDKMNREMIKGEMTKKIADALREVHSQL